MSILSKIIAEKKKEVLALAEAPSLPLRDYAPKSLRDAIWNCKYPAIIAEVKKASPSKGDIRPDLNPAECARGYQDSGAAAISVVTDNKFFKGDINYLMQIREACPEAVILRKDFIIDPVQVEESFLAGADAILLIARALNPQELGLLFREATRKGLECLVEVHDKEELEKVFQDINPLSKKLLLGVNNRNLEDFTVNRYQTRLVTERLKEMGLDNLPLIAESGIEDARDVNEIRDFGADAFLIGESLVRSGEPGSNLSRLMNDIRN